MTQTQSGIVTPVSAILVAMTILRTPGGGVLKTALWPSDDTLQAARKSQSQRWLSRGRRKEGVAHLEWRGKTMKPALPNAGCSWSMSLRRRISLLQSGAHVGQLPRANMRVEGRSTTHSPGMKMRTEAEYWE